MKANLSAALRHLLRAAEHVAHVCERTRNMLDQAVARLVALLATQRAAA